MNKRLAQYNLFWWYTYSIATRIFFIYLPIISILILINSQEKDFMLKIAFQVMKFLLGLLLIFNIFVKKKNISAYIPKKSETSNQQNTYFMYFALTTVLYISLLLSEVENRILEVKHSHVIPWYIHLIGIIFSLMFIRDLMRKKMQLQLFGTSKKENNYETEILIGKASKKLRKHLDQKEIEELEELMLVEAETEVYTVNYLGRLVFYSIVLALLYGVVQELIGRGYLELAR